jgi:hypothetical protein
MRARDMNTVRESELLRSTGKDGQKRNPTVCLMPTKAASNTPYFKQSRSAA